jgi:hypothetical protein
MACRRSAARRLSAEAGSGPAPTVEPGQELL